MLFATPSPRVSVASSPAVERVASRSLLAPGREAGFLDIDFHTTPRPELVTRLLALTESGSADNREVETSLWQLSVATRLKRLLRIVRETCELTALSVLQRCPHPGCHQLLELELSLDELDALHDEAADGELLHFPPSGPRARAFRRATGDDLRCWRTSPPTPETVLRSLLVPESNAPDSQPAELPPLTACAEAFSEFEGLVAFEFTAHCAHCGRHADHGVDLETMALRQLEVLQERLYRENHRLALAYGWSEPEMLQVPRARRLRYLAELEATK